jgi:hypothetical protein
MQESSSVDMSKVNMGWSTLTIDPFFFLAGLRFRIFLLVGEKKLEEKKKVRKQVEANGPDLPSHPA